ncbi:hypothetical protein Tco_1522540 [Tanacetum coccineum]
MEGSKVLKDLLSHKEKLEKAASSVKLSEECFAIIQRSLLQKEGDPGSFTLPCLIGPLAVKNAIADLGASCLKKGGITVVKNDKDELIPPMVISQAGGVGFVLMVIDSPVLKQDLTSPEQIRYWLRDIRNYRS